MNVGFYKRDAYQEVYASDVAISRETGGLAQLARAPALHAGGQRFESVILHNGLVVDHSSLTYWN